MRFSAPQKSILQQAVGFASLPEVDGLRGFSFPVRSAEIAAAHRLKERGLLHVKLQPLEGRQRVQRAEVRLTCEGERVTLLMIDDGRLKSA